MRGELIRSLCLVVLLSFFCSLNAVLVEPTASLNALNGVTTLSNNAGDYSFSPVIASRGISSSFCNNFGNSAANLYSLVGAERIGYFYVASGLSLQSTEGFRWQDHFVSLSMAAENFALGVSPHLTYQSTGDNAGRYDWSWDAAFRGEVNGYGTEVRLLRMDSEDREVHLTAYERVNELFTVATTYIWGIGTRGYVRSAATMRVIPELEFQSSWQSDPSRLGAGIRVYLNDLKFGYSVRTHDDLDLTHSLDLGFNW